MLIGRLVGVACHALVGGGALGGLGSTFGGLGGLGSTFGGGLGGLPGVGWLVGRSESW